MLFAKDEANTAKKYWYKASVISVVLVILHITNAQIHPNIPIKLYVTV